MDHSRTRWTTRGLMVLVVWSLSASTLADPLNECPSRAFLSQRTNATLYAINLVTGHFELLEDRMGAGKINAIGFSVHDRYFYAWSYQHDSVARIGDDYQIESMNMQNITNNGFFVGDVAVTENAYYVYRRGGNYGLYRIPLNPDADDYLQMSRVVDGSTLDLRIFDLAFHPTNGTAYAVDSSGRLWEINVQSGSATQLANVGQTGTFGAGYFDVEGRLYFSRNKDGNVFVVDIDQQQYTASLFALGPSSSTNDGARCALAPVTDSNNTDIDFGDAPQSYGTMLADNGARHGLSLNPSLYLGDGVDGESDASPAPLADDSVDGNDDEDGVDFATGLQAGNTAILVVRAAAVGNLNAWIDVNQSGTFDAGEQIISDRTVTEGTNLVAVNIPASADVGDTWARFRLSSSSGVPPTGGVSDGEVEDYPVTIGASNSATVWYPSRNGWSTVAFEDNWPIEGDYDMNDLVTTLRTAVSRENDQINYAFVRGEVVAVGAAYQNGFAIRLPGVPRTAIDEAGVILTINGYAIERTVLDTATNDATFLISYNLFNFVSAGEGCDFYRTEPGCEGGSDMGFELFVPLSTPLSGDLMGVFDPFLFATPGAWHGGFFTDPPGRSYEIHLKNYAPTAAIDDTIFGQQQDASDPDMDRYYQTENGLPWALEIPIEWKYPREYMDLLWAYPQFEGFVESNGTENRQWFLEENADAFFLFDAEEQE